MIRRNRFTKLLLSLSALLMLAQPSYAALQEEELAKLLADYLVKARAVLAMNQALINDSGRGDKSFTPDVYGRQVADDFKKMTGKDLAALSSANFIDKALLQLHESAKETIAEAQPQINDPGKGFKGFSPAIFGKRASDKFYKKSAIRIKQTSLKYRNASNKPDEFEERMLQKFEAPGWEKMKSYSEIVGSGDKKAARYMLPLYIGNACLTCHGDPAGELDIAGRKKEGYKVGEVRGAVSVSVPIK